MNVKYWLCWMIGAVALMGAPALAQTTTHQVPAGADQASPSAAPAASAPPTSPSSTDAASKPMAPALALPTGTTASAPIAAEQFAFSPGGVDMRTGAYKHSKTDLSLGGAGDAGLTLDRIMQGTLQYNQPFGTHFSHNWDIRLTEDRIQVAEATTPARYDFQITISYGGLSTSFRSLWAGTDPWTQISNDGQASLTHTGAKNGAAVYTFTARDGTVVVFRPMLGTSYAFGSECAKNNAIDRCVFASTITKPNGTKFTLEYDSAGGFSRLRSVTSSRGFALLNEYQATASSYNLISKSCALNLAITAKPATNICPAGVQTASYAYSGLFLTSATDPGTNTYTYTQPVAGQVKMFNPGEATPVVTADMGIIPNDGLVTDAQQFTSGPTYSYAFNVVSQGEAGGFRAGGSYTDNLGGTVSVTYGDYPSIVFNDPTRIITPGPVSVADQLNRVTTQDFCIPVSGTGACKVWVLQSQTMPDGQKSFFTYDNGSRSPPTQTRQVAKAGTGLADIITSASYINGVAKAVNKPAYIIDARGIRTSYTYDPAHGGVLTETSGLNAAGTACTLASGICPQKRYSYTQLFAWDKDAAGTLVQAPTSVWMLTGTSECKTLASCVGTADETKTTITYGAAGTANNLLPISQTVSAGNNSISSTATNSYDAIGNLLTVDGPLAGAADTVRYRYDVLRRVVGEAGPDPDGAGTLKHRATRNTYDASGRLTKVEKGTVNSQSDADWAAFAVLQSADTVYDIQSRKVRQSLSSGGVTYSVTQYSYDVLGRLECTAVRMDPAQWAGQTNACVPQTTGPNGPDRVTKLFYNAASEIIKTQLAVGTADQSDEETNTYTLNGKLATVTDAENNRTTLEYDGHDRLAKTRFPVPALGALASSTTDYEGLTYDANGNVTQRRLRDGQLINSTYDNLNRVTLKDLPDPETDVSYTYDLMDRMVTATQGTSVTQAYDALGRMVSETTPLGTTSYQYDAAGRRTRLTWADGFYVTQDYLVTGEVSAIRESGVASGVGVLATYAYDNLGRRTTLTRGNGAITRAEFDGVSRLTGLQHDFAGTTSDVTYGRVGTVGTAIGYNPASQITTYTRDNDSYRWNGHYNVNRTYGTNGLNQLTTAGPTTLGYDLRGNLTTSGTSGYTYTAENRMVTGPGAASLNYDPTGRLSQTVGVGVTTRFGYDGTDLIAEHNAAGTLLRRYVHGPGDDEPLVWYEGSGTTDRRWLHADERGSIVAISNTANSAMGLYSYDEYGIPASSNCLSTGTTCSRFQYTGQTWLKEVGLYYYKARVYSPYLGRFMQTDPIGYGDGINWYDYASGDPVNGSDPSGLVSQSSLPSTGGLEGCGTTDPQCGYILGGPSQFLDAGTARTIAQGAVGAAAVLVADDATVIGVADDPLLVPVLAVAAVATVSAVVIEKGPGWSAKARKEIASILQKTGPETEQYALLAGRSGNFPNVRGGSSYLNKGDVWKYGVTGQGETGRYGGRPFPAGLQYVRQYRGRYSVALTLEKAKITTYLIRNGYLPPGNRIRR